MTLGVTKKVPLSCEVRLGSYRMAGSAISFFTMLFSANPAVQPNSLVTVRVRCGVGLGVSIFVA